MCITTTQCKVHDCVHIRFLLLSTLAGSQILCSAGSLINWHLCVCMCVCVYDFDHKNKTSSPKNFRHQKIKNKHFLLQKNSNAINRFN